MVGKCDSSSVRTNADGKGSRVDLDDVKVEKKAGGSLADTKPSRVLFLTRR